MKHKTSEHPSHEPHLKRLSRVRGQVDGIEKMILDRRYCPDIVIQIRAATKALAAIEAEILKTHLRGCVQTAVKSKNEKEIAKKIDEIMTLVNR